jgi:hypothetical protein
LLFFFVFHKICQIFNAKIWRKKPWSWCWMEVTRCISAILDIYFSFISIKFGKKNLFSYFNF